MKFNVDINGVKYVGDGGFATEDTLAKLLKAYGTVNKTALKATQAADRALSGLADSASDAGDGLIEFDDAITEAGTATERAAGKLKDMGERATDAASNLFNIGESGSTFSSMISSVGDAAGSALEGIGKLVPIAGDGIGQLGKQAATVAFGLAALAVSMIESFADLNKELLNSGMSIRGGFDEFTEYAEDSGIPLQEFSSALMANSKQLRLMSGGAPGGIKNISAAFKDMGTETRGMLYSLGYSTEDIVSSMAEFSVQAQKSGKALTPGELATQTSSYLKSLRELSRLTGVSVKDAQAKADADRSNLFVQANLLKVNEKYRASASQFINSIDEAYAPIKDLIQTGTTMTTQGGIMAREFPTMAKIMQESYASIADGSMTFEQATASMNNRIKQGGAQITDEYVRMVQTWGAGPAELFGGMADGLGEAGVVAQEMVIASFSKDAADAGKVIEGSLQDTFGTLETTLQSAKVLIQGTFIDGLVGASPMIEGFLRGMGLGAEGLTTFKETLGEIIGGDWSSITDLFERMRVAIVDSIGSGLELGFIKVMQLLNPLGDYTSDKVNADGTVTEGYGTLDGIALKTAETALWAWDSYADLVNGTVNGIFGTEIQASTLADSFNKTMNDPAMVDLMMGREAYKSGMDEAARAAIAAHGAAKYDAESQEIYRRLKSGDGMSDGGIASGPTSGYAALLHGTEAVVPLPDGRSIPVDMSGFRTMLESALAPDSDPTEVANAMDELASTFSLDSSKIIDGSRTMPELLQINKSLLQQYFALNEKFERMVKAMEDGNNINRSSAFARA